jgi:hypothetical protein
MKSRFNGVALVLLFGIISFFSSCGSNTEKKEAIKYHSLGPAGFAKKYVFRFPLNKDTAQLFPT